ncbi:NCS1 family nucleobase:cation symporter-1 [Edwardsiella tarda]|uniref:NCS1 family nucleobase:cation symporter-1 n=1 Tax=Edwardsiella tarda TaxID=636 RepID=UPI00351C72B6
MGSIPSALSGCKNIYNEYTKPVVKRTWGIGSFASLWIGIMVSIPALMLGTGIIQVGMSWSQALFTVVLGHTIVMLPAVLLGHPGAKYGINFPLLSRAVFGIKGSIIPTLVRAILGCFWFGVTAWIGGQAITNIISIFFPAYSSLGFVSAFLSFFLFVLLNIIVAFNENAGVKWLADKSALILIFLSLLVILWALSVSGWSVSELLSQPAVSGKEDLENFWIIFFPALSSFIAFDSTIALNMSDFTKNAKNQRSQFLGQIIFAPLATAYIVFVGVAMTAGSSIAFNEVIWDPVVLISRFESPSLVIITSAFILLATLTTNVPANLIPPANVFNTLISNKVKAFKYWYAVVLVALLSVFGMPWKVLADPDNLIFVVLGMLGALLGPITGIYLVSYWIENKTKIDMVDLYKVDSGRYQGVNKNAVIALLSVWGGIMLSKNIDALAWLYDSSYVFGLFLGAFVYFALSKVSANAANR